MDKVTEAVEFIQQSIQHEWAFVGFSGGKDSIVTADLVKKSGVRHQLYYSFTGLDAPEVIQFINKNYPECEKLMPRVSFWRDLSTNVPPSNRLRWCCTALKKSPGFKIPLINRIMGIRAEESVKRAKYPKVNYFKKLDHTHYYPILHWTEADIWDYIYDNNLAYPKLYDEGFDRIGCVVCPYHSEKTGLHHKKYRDRWPKFFERFERGISELYYKRADSGREMYYHNPQEFLDAWYLSNSARWYK